MIERLIADASMADYQRYAERQQLVREARKLFPKADTPKVERDPVIHAPKVEQRPDPLNY